VVQRFDAAGQRVGAEVLANTRINGEQRDPTLAVLSDGSFVVTWMGHDNQDGSGWGVFAQRFAADGSKAGAEFRVNSVTQNEQYSPFITALSGGGFVVTWRDNSTDGVKGQVFSAQGAKAGNEFQVNTYMPHWQYQPSVSAAPDGGFWAVWASEHQDGSSRGVYLQRFSDQGEKVGVERRVNTTLEGVQFQPQIAVQPDGRFAVVWSSANQDGAGYAVIAQ
jgi:hypothetical protein